MGRSDGQQPITDHTQAPARKVRQGGVHCSGQHSQQEPIEKLLVIVLGVQHCTAQHGKKQQLEADKDEADRSGGQKRARNEASRPHGSRAPHSTKGASREPCRLQWGPGHQPTAGSPAAGGWAQGNEGILTSSRRRAHVSSPAPPSPVGEDGAGVLVRPCCTAGARAGQWQPGSTAAQPQRCREPCPQGHPCRMG